MRLQTESYEQQEKRWPTSGRCILAQYDEETIVVYQAYRPSIGHFAARHGYFGGDFSLTRMTWVKPNFLWMMYRNGWGTKEGQEVTLAVCLRRSAFDFLLANAVASAFEASRLADRDAWSRAVQESEVRLQWDPDHDPRGKKLERRAIQLGMRGSAIQQYARDWLIGIEDVSSFVSEQRAAALEGRWGDLVTPEEHVYPVDDVSVRERLGLEGTVDPAD